MSNSEPLSKDFTTYAPVRASIFTVTAKDGSEIELEAFDAADAKARAERNLRMKVASVKPWSGAVCSVRLD